MKNTVGSAHQFGYFIGNWQQRSCDRFTPDSSAKLAKSADFASYARDTRFQVK
jgi:hypothetical protein